MRDGFRKRRGRASGVPDVRRGFAEETRDVNGKISQFPKGV
jgi:hypothetical protein